MSAPSSTPATAQAPVPAPAPAPTPASTPDGRDAPVRGRRLPQHVRIGSVWVSLMEPEDGHDAAFNRWYGDDHFYAGGMSLPWVFAGRR